MKLRQDTTYQKGSIVRHSKIAPPMTAMGVIRDRRDRSHNTVPVRFAPKADKEAGIALSPLCADFVAKVVDGFRAE
jgi:hypothetical protein